MRQPHQGCATDKTIIGDFIQRVPQCTTPSRPLILNPYSRASILRSNACDNVARPASISIPCTLRFAGVFHRTTTLNTLTNQMAYDRCDKRSAAAGWVQYYFMVKSTQYVCAGFHHRPATEQEV